MKLKKNNIEVLPRVRKMEDEYTLGECKVEALLTLAENCASVDGNPRRSEDYAMEAINLLDTLPKRGRLVFELYSKFANFLLCRQYFSEAIKWVDILIEMSSNFPEIKTSKAEWLLTKASTLQQSGRLREAEKVHRQLSKLKKKDYPKELLERKMFEFEHYGSLALCLVLQNKKLKEAKKFARKSFSIMQNSDSSISFLMHKRCAHFSMVMPIILHLENPMVPKFIEIWGENIIGEERFFQQETDVRRFRKNVKKDICCSVCFKQSTKLKTCSACGQESKVRYCSKKCQQKDWKKHKKICVSRQGRR